MSKVRPPKSRICSETCHGYFLSENHSCSSRHKIIFRCICFQTIFLALQRVWVSTVKIVSGGLPKEIWFYLSSIQSTKYDKKMTCRCIAKNRKSQKIAFRSMKPSSTWNFTIKIYGDRLYVALLSALVRLFLLCF